MSKGYKKKRRRLTQKQERFVEAIASGDAPTLVQAYTDAGYADKSNPATLRKNASRLANKTHVVPTLEERKAAYKAKAEASTSASKAYVLRRLREEADNADSRASERISALALLAKASGALDDAVDREGKRSTANENELASELMQRLSVYVEEPLDVTPEHVADTLEGVDTHSGVSDT